MQRRGFDLDALDVWTTRDPEGRVVTLTDERWQHICDRHWPLRPFRREILAVLTNHVARLEGRRTGEVWFYGAGFGPTRFAKVVVHYEGGTGTIATAFPRRRIP